MHYDITVSFADGTTARCEFLSLDDIHAIVDTFKNLSITSATITPAE